MHHCATNIGAASRRGFSLVEMLLAVFILGIGVISIAALFPAGIVLQRQATDDVVGPIVAKNAFATIRSKLSQGDFGSFQDFEMGPQFLNPGNAGTIAPVGGNAIPQIPGDWGWMRPGFLFGTNTLAQNPNSIFAITGTIDVFSAAYTRQNHPTAFDTFAPGAKATEIEEGVFNAAGNLVLFGVPYNPRKYPLFTIAPAARPLDLLSQRLLEPSVTFTQAERSWPQPTLNTLAADATTAAASSITPTYFWDCMFRRNGGSVQVAVFVYRVTQPGGQAGAGSRQYWVQPNVAATLGGPAGGAFSGAFQAAVGTPPIPAFFRAPNFGNGSLATSWPARTGTNPQDELPGTAANAANSFGGPEQIWDDWQAPSAWLIDNHGTVHKVQNGRLAVTQGPVKLQRRVPIVPPSPVNGVLPTSAQQNDANAFISGVWFVPRRDRNGNVITPVFAAVEEL
ncbi:MAG: prepilin-type N-terminal cleavage/methylation domain-containing protein [Limnohabitans sp.]|jgi:prepilin-type N-terminal cleavage/methylation domain-containing protein|nr:prepilin-type N-terminal cleavage/methylation domain-containing protein [Limnohabitans sp.]